MYNKFINDHFPVYFYWLELIINDISHNVKKINDI